MTPVLGRPGRRGTGLPRRPVCDPAGPAIPERRGH